MPEQTGNKQTRQAWASRTAAKGQRRAGPSRANEGTKQHRMREADKGCLERPVIQPAIRSASAGDKESCDQRLVRVQGEALVTAELAAQLVERPAWWLVVGRHSQKAVGAHLRQGCGSASPATRMTMRVPLQQSTQRHIQRHPPPRCRPDVRRRRRHSRSALALQSLHGTSPPGRNASPQGLAGRALRGKHRRNRLPQPSQAALAVDGHPLCGIDQRR